MRLSKPSLAVFSKVFFAACLVVPSLVEAQSETGAYRRGDTNQDGAQDITDGIEILSHVILGQPADVPCEKCIDVDDNGEKDINDGITLLRFVILGSADIPEPFRRCGYDPTPDRLSCSFYRPCRCGTIAGIPCRPSEICDPDPGSCDIADAAGYCVPQPGDACPEIFDPVCGCDGVTYDNDCFRLQAGAQKDHRGSCRPESCDGFAGIFCEDGQFCDHPVGTCDVADGAGVCVDVPGACLAIFDPVCGCDGVTYGNDCERVRAGAQKDHDGECGEQVCGGIAGIPCDEGEICDLPPGACNSADLQGVCVPRPEVCPDVWDPVCGCDGVTYGNECERLAVGAQKDHDGPCINTCGGIAGFPCDEGEFCDHGAGACNIADAGGQCVAMPEACPEIFDPVCGCNGKTYSNDCERIRAGAQKDHDGPCQPDFCDGFAGFPCEDGQFCDHPAGTCNVADGAGVCVAVPGACAAVFDPVCGCDGVTYGNDCERIRAGAQKDHDGECQRVDVCGGIAGIPCDAGQICDLPAGKCEFADLQGVCVPRPQGCPDVWDPVCGCDGVTYGNDCERLSAGAQEDHDGACINICGGIAGFPCDEGEFCDHGAGTCNIANAAGQCVAVPVACPEIFDPVCGCDGVTYGNDCERLRAGAQKDHDGPCIDICDGIAAFPCRDGEFCDHTPGLCNGADIAGHCVRIPDGCARIFDPVCGCDGKTYSNDCERIRAGAQKDHDGMCGQSSDVCGGFAGVPCERGEFCDLPEGLCNTADLQGTCVPRSEICLAIYDPVCGCNGVTYGNDCERIGAGIQKDHDGECE
jgi:hypothetical protein